MLILRIFISENTRQRLIMTYILISSVCFVISYLEVVMGLESIKMYHAPLTALEKTNEKALAYMLIIVGCTGMKVNFIGISITFSQKYINKRTIGYTWMMNLINCVKFFVVIISLTTIVFHQKASYRPLVDRTDGFGRAMLKYRSNVTYKMAIDEIQYEFKCCGNKKIQDWLKIRWYRMIHSSNKLIKGVPFSCCDSMSEFPCQHHNVLEHLKTFPKTNNKSSLTVYVRGCFEAFYDSYIYFLIYAACVPIILNVILCIFLIIILRYLETSIYRSIKSGYLRSKEFGYLFSWGQDGSNLETKTGQLRPLISENVPATSPIA